MKRTLAIAAAVLSLILGIALGGVSFSPRDLFTNETARQIVLNLRIPRVLGAFLVGATLSLVGNSFQGLFKNPLIDPYLMGVSAGASFGAALSLSLAERYGYVWVNLAPLMAFGTAVLSSLIALLMARRGGEISQVELVLTGASMNVLFGALTLFFLFYLRRSSQGFTTWMFGSLSATIWSDLPPMLIALALSLTPPLFLWNKLDAMSMGENFAKVVGVETELVKLSVYLTGVLATAMTVAKVGSIGFVGLVIPHIVRRVYGYSHRVSAPMCAVLGGTFLVLSDLISRVVARPSEVPIGIVTAFVGVPFFFYILRRR